MVKIEAAFNAIAVQPLAHPTRLAGLIRKKRIIPGRLRKKRAGLPAKGKPLFEGWAGRSKGGAASNHGFERL
jgi:hypothetical protein